MKKIIILLVPGAFCLIASHALAFPFKQGDKLTYKRLSGSPATLTAKGESKGYDAFCMQYGVEIGANKGYYAYSVGELSLSDNSKWLYAAYQEGAFDSMDYDSLYQQYGQGEELSLDLIVQYGIWYSEGSSVGSPTLSKKMMKASWNLFDDYLTDSFNWNTYKDYWDIRSIGLSRDRFGWFKKQAQIVGERTGNPSEVPEPATMALLGFGLMGVAGVARRRGKEKN